MRTTVTLDKDVAAMLKRAQARRREPLKKIVNDALREGLARLEAPRRTGAPYRRRRPCRSAVAWSATSMTWRGRWRSPRGRPSADPRRRESARLRPRGRPAPARDGARPARRAPQRDRAGRASVAEPACLRPARLESAGVRASRDGGDGLAPGRSVARSRPGVDTAAHRAPSRHGRPPAAGG